MLELELELYFYLNTVNLSDKIIIIKITIYFTLYISCLRAFRVHLISLVASFVFDVLESSWTGISLWLIFEKRRNEVLSRAIFFGAGRKQKRVYTRWPAFFIAYRSRSLVGCFYCLVRMQHDLLASNVGVFWWASTFWSSECHLGFKLGRGLGRDENGS